MVMKKTLSEIISLTSIAPGNEPFIALADGTVILVRRPSEADLERIHSLTRNELAASKVPLSVIKAVHNRNKDVFWGVYQAPEADRSNATLLGYYAFLHLNEAGHQALERGEFSGNNPDLTMLVPSGVRPAAIYIWAVVARRLARIATPLVTEALGRRTYGGLPIYATAGTMGGRNVIRGYGFHRAREAENSVGHLYRLDPPRPAQKINAA